MASPDDGEEEAIVRCGTTKGDITLQLIREWSPNGYDRAVELFERHFYDGSHFFRAVPKFLVQFGISYSGDKELQRFSKRSIRDDPPHDPGIGFELGTISFAGSGPDSRTSQLFFSYGANKGLGKQKWETPIGKVIEGMENAEEFYSYGDMPPWGNGPVQGKIYNGPQYIENNFPLIDKFLECTVERNAGAGSDSRSGSGDAEQNVGAGSDSDSRSGSVDAVDAVDAIDDVDAVDAGEDADADGADDGAGVPVRPSDGDDDFLLSKSERKRLRLRYMAEEQDDQTFVFAGIVVLIVLVIVGSVRGRSKVGSKMN